MRVLLAAAAIGWGAVALGARIPAIAAVGAHEAAHCYLEGPPGPVCQAEFHGDLSDPVIYGEAEVRSGRQLPHIVPRAIGWLVGGLVVLPAVLLAAAALREERP